MFRQRSQTEPPFSPALRHVIISDGALRPATQRYQDLIDALFFGMAGLTGDEAKALSERYAKML